MNDNDTIPSKLGFLLPGTEVINAGYAEGFGPDSYYLYLANKGFALNPDLVIFSIFVFNDLSDIENSEWVEIQEKGLPKRIESKIGFVSKEGYFVNQSLPFEYRIPILRDSNLWLFAFNNRLTLRVKNFWEVKITDKKEDMVSSNEEVFNCYFRNACVKDIDKVYAKLEKLLIASKNESQEHKADFLVVLIPADFQIYPDVWQSYYNLVLKDLDKVEISSLYPQKRIIEIMEQRGIDFLDLTEAVRNNNFQKLYFKNDHHFNGRGNDVVAQAIVDYLK